MFSFIQSIASFFSSLFTYISNNNLIKLGKLEQREFNRKEFNRKKKIVDKIRNNNVIDASDKWLRPPDDTDK